MDFDDKKLEVEAIAELLPCSIASVKPYALMIAPVYVYMKLNEKLVSVKAPLDFFTKDELEGMKRYQKFYMPKFVESASRFQTAAKVLRSLLKIPANGEERAPYEISNEVIQIVGPLWGSSYRVEPFFASVLADELCGSLDPEKMVETRETAVSRHDLGLLLSGTVVFVLLHLGWHDLETLKSIRNETYARTADGENWEKPVQFWESVNQDLLTQIEEKMPLDRDSLSFTASEWAKKLLGRLRRIEKVPNVKKYESLSIHGPGGFAA